MLTRKNLLWLTGILVVLIVIATAQKTSHERWTSRASSAVLVAGQFERADLARVVIGHGRDPAAVELVAGPAGWTVSTAWGARTSTQRLDTLLQSLGDLRGEFRGDSSEVLGDFGFTDSTTVVIRGVGQSGDDLFHLEVGGRPEMGTGNFVKLPGTSAVYLTSQNLLGNLGLWGGAGRPENRHFLELQALRLDREAIDAIRLEGETSLTLTKDHVMIEPSPEDTVFTDTFADRSQWEWRLDGGQPAVKTKADAVLGAVSNLRAQDVADPTTPLSAYGLEPPAQQAIIVLEDGSETVLSIGSQREAAGDTPGGFYARVGEDATIWVIGEFNVNNIFKTRQELLPES